MMKRIILLMALVTSVGCLAQHSNSLSEVDIHAPHNVQIEVIDATKKFGQKNGYTVYATDNLPREGRLVSQVLLTRADGVSVVASNFMDKEVLRTDFYAEKEGADWRTAKEIWLAEMRTVVGDRGQIINVILEEIPKP